MAAPALDEVVRAVLGVRAALAATPLREALEPTAERDLVVLYETQSVGDALQTLAAWNLLSAPVVKGPPPWHKRAAGEGAPSPFAPASTRNPRMRDLLGFLSVNTIMRAFVAETQDIRAERSEEVAAAARELWDAQLSEAFDSAALALDWEVIGASPRDESGTWAVRGVPSAHRSILDVIAEGFLAPSRAARFLEPRAPSLGAAPPGAPGGAGAHRVAVWARRGDDETSEAVLVNVFSQSDAVRFLARRGGALSDAPAAEALLSAPLAALGLGTSSEAADGGAVIAPRPVATVDAETPVLAALRRMAEEGLSALAVVDAEGKLLSNISASDLRSLTPQHLGALALPVAAFLEGIGRMRYYTYSGLAAKDITKDALAKAYRSYEHFRMLRGRRPHAPAHPVGDVEGDTIEGWAGVGVHPTGTLPADERKGFADALRPDAPLLDALRHMAHAGHHRIYVVDEQDKPVGVVTLTDVLRLVASDVTLDWLASRAGPAAGGAGEFHWRKVAREAGADKPLPPPAREE